MLPPGDAEKYLWLAECLERLGRMPVRLGDDADAKALRLQQPADDRHAEAWMVDIGIARHQHDVAGVPAERIHLVAAHGQEWRRLARARQSHQGLFGVIWVSMAPTHRAPGRRIQPAVSWEPTASAD